METGLTINVLTDHDGPRLRYVLDWLFQERLGIDYRVFQEESAFFDREGLKLNYTTRPIKGALHIAPSGLLREGSVQDGPPALHRWKHTSILFYNQPGALIPFDIFSAIFYMLCRLEEQGLPHRDKHGRFDSSKSVAVVYRFYQEPVVDQWAQRLKQIIENMGVPMPSRPAFSYRPTFDLDMAWKYQHKGPLRSLGGLARDLLLFRWREACGRVLTHIGANKDPFYNFAALKALHDSHGYRPLVFILAGKGSAYDKNTSMDTKAMRSLVAELGSQGPIGLHPSYYSAETEAYLLEEKKTLEQITGTPIDSSRQHYIRFSLPGTYRSLASAGIRHEYSMGYPDFNGFRAGTSHSFLWYDVEREQTMAMRVHPFAFMDASSRFNLKQNPDEAYKEWERLYHAVARTGGTFISIWHNHVIGNDRAGKPWRALYEKTLEAAR